MKKFCLLLAVLFFAEGCSQNYTWGWYVLNPQLDSGYSNLFFLLMGAYITISISFLSVFFSIIIGFFISLLGMTSNMFLILLKKKKTSNLIKRRNI